MHDLTNVMRHPMTLTMYGHHLGLQQLMLLSVISMQLLRLDMP